MLSTLGESDACCPQPKGSNDRLHEQITFPRTTHCVSKMLTFLSGRFRQELWVGLCFVGKVTVPQGEFGGEVTVTIDALPATLDLQVFTL